MKVGSVFSTMGDLKCGVPQGSVLGAILFIIYANDLRSARKRGFLTSFADDTELSYVEPSWNVVQSVQ